MITIGEQTFDLSDPAVLAVLAGAMAIVLLFVLLALTLKRSGRSAAAAEALAGQLGHVAGRVQMLSDGQQQLAGGLTHVSEAQAASQASMLKLMESRLAQVSETMNENLASSARNTSLSLGELQQRLKTIDKAQENITRLSGDVLSLQDILSNKQRRGMFGEIQLTDIVAKALPPDAYAMQATLSNGKKADCLIHLPNPPGPIVIDAKFPFEAFERYAAAETKDAQERALRELGAAVRIHIRAISEKYIIEGETADGALMFLPSEAIYAELHARLPQVIREGFAARVWIVSPTTCMATLHTMRAILKDARMREQAGEIRKALALLHRDVELVVERVGKLNTHFGQARKDLDDINIAAERAGKRAGRLDNFDFEELAADAPSTVVPMKRPDA
jgi:DNA recombination protein RmuC